MLRQKTSSSVNNKIKGLHATELISGVAVAATLSSPESSNQLITRKEATAGLSAAVPLTTQTLSPPTVSTTASVGISITKIKINIDTEMSTSTSTATSNIINYSLLGYKSLTPFTYYVVPKGQKQLAITNLWISKK